MHDVAGLKNPGSTRIERGIDAGHGEKREIGRAKLAFARSIKININFVEAELARTYKCVALTEDELGRTSDARVNV